MTAISCDNRTEHNPLYGYHAEFSGIKLGEIGWDGTDWIELAQDTDQWRALVNTVINLRVP
jgi:hypothetical protein